MRNKINFKYVIQSFNKSMQPRNHQAYHDAELFHYPEKLFHTHLLSSFPSPSILATTDLSLSLQLHLL